MQLHLNQYLLGGVAKNLRWRLSTSSSTGMLSNPHRWPLWVGVIFTQTSLLPEALTPSNKLANKESLSKVKNKKILGLIIKGNFDSERSTGPSAGNLFREGTQVEEEARKKWGFTKEPGVPVLALHFAVTYLVQVTKAL